MANADRKVEAKIQIDGIYYTILSDKSLEETMTIADYVNNKIVEAKAANRSLNSTMAATLIALNIANELDDLKQLHTEYCQQTEEAYREYGPLQLKFKEANLIIYKNQEEISDLKDKLVNDLSTINQLNADNKSLTEMLAEYNKNMAEKDALIKSLQDQILAINKKLMAKDKLYQEENKKINEKKN